MSILSGYFFNSDNAGPVLCKNLKHLSEYAASLAETKVIGQHDSERLVSHNRTTAKNCVSQSLHLYLTSVGKSTFIDQITDA